jgi:hypothetical protein
MTGQNPPPMTAKTAMSFKLKPGPLTANGIPPSPIGQRTLHSALGLGGGKFDRGADQSSEPGDILG